MKFKKSPKCLMKRTSSKGKEAIRIGDQICENNFYISAQFPSTVVTEVKDIWYYTYLTDNTFKSYLFGLQPISYLTNAYEESKDMKYLIKAKEILMEYLKFLELKVDGRADREFVISTRTITIIYLLSFALSCNIFNSIELKKIEELLIYNSKFLKDSSNYLYSNHGMWQDLALLTLSLLEISNINNDEIIEIALGRINYQINMNFTEEYINIENSFFYHKYNLYLIEKIYDFIQREMELNIRQNKMLLNIEVLVKEGNRVFGEFIKPDGTCTLIGDTEEKLYKEYKYIPRNAIFSKTGLVFLKSNNYFMSAKSGVQGRGHKHLDDLSFTFYYKDIDLFIDCGKYTYETSNKFTTTMWSVFGHNTLIVNEEDYKIKNKGIYLSDENRAKTGISKFESENSYEYISLFNYFYDDIKLRRDYIFIKPNNIFILDYYDNSLECENNMLTQNFVVNEELKLIRKDNNNIELIAVDKGIKLDITQLLNDNILEYNYKNDKNYKGYSSKKFGVLNGAHNFEFKKIVNSNGIKNITQIGISSNDKEEKDISIAKIINKLLYIKYDDTELIYDLESRKLSKNKLEIEVAYKDKELFVRASGFYGRVACYVEIDGNKKLKSMYQNSGEFSFNNVEGNLFKIRVYTKSEITNSIGKVNLRVK